MNEKHITEWLFAIVVFSAMGGWRLCQGFYPSKKIRREDAGKYVKVKEMPEGEVYELVEDPFHNFEEGRKMRIDLWSIASAVFMFLVVSFYLVRLLSAIL